MPKKTFINKKDANTVTFRGVRQSQGDPLSGDFKVPPLIFVPASESDSKKQVKFTFFENPTVVQETSIQRLVPQKGPRPDWDPDIVAALDDDFNYDDEDNILEDDFMAIVNEICEDENEVDSDGSYLFSEDDDDQFGGTKSKMGLTEYSLTSVRTSITEEYKTFNEKFEKFCETYDNDQIGDLEGEEIAGNLLPENDMVDEFIKDLGNQKKARFQYDSTLDINMQDRIINLADSVDNEKMVKIVLEPPEEYDCESIISTYSNKFNHPTLIRANVEKKKLTKSHVKQLNRENKNREESNSDSSECSYSVMSASTFRPKNETPEQRRIRKQAVKLIRRENRAIKKENKLAFKEEKKRQNSVAMNVRRNVGFRMF